MVILVEDNNNDSLPDLVLLPEITTKAIVNNLKVRWVFYYYYTLSFFKCINRIELTIYNQLMWGTEALTIFPAKKWEHPLSFVYKLF